MWAQAPQNRRFRSSHCWHGAGLFSRACQTLSDSRKQHDLAEELGGLKAALLERLEGIAGGLTDERRIMDGNVWLGQDEAEAVTSQLAPKLEKSRSDIEAMLFEVVTLEVGSSPAAFILLRSQALSFHALSKTRDHSSPAMPILLLGPALSFHACM